MLESSWGRWGSILVMRVSKMARSENRRVIPENNWER